MTALVLFGAVFAALNAINHAARGEWGAAAFQGFLFVALFVMFRSANRRAVRPEEPPEPS